MKKHIPTVFLQVVTLGCFIALTGCSKPPEVAAPDRPVRVMVVGALGEAGAKSSDRFTGEIRSRLETVLSFRVPGKISARHVQLGQAVKAGQLLAELDVTDNRLNADAARSQAKLAESDLKRFRDLREKNFVSVAALEAKETAFQAAQSQAGVLAHQQAYTRLLAEHSGVVAAVLAEDGQVLTAGQPVFKIARTDQLEVAINVSEAQVSQLKIGMSAKVSLWADAGVQLDGVVREVSAVSELPARTYAVRVSINSSPELKLAQIRLGQTAEVSFAAAGTKSSQIKIPLSAIFQQDKQPAVWVVTPADNSGKSRIELRAVTVAAWEEDGARLSGGLKSGEVIAAAGVHKLTAGETIKAVQQ